jgi:transcriptional regulator with XRE-family HTH domain
MLLYSMLNSQVKDAQPDCVYALPLMETMGDRIRTLREARKLTQEGLGSEVGVTKSAVSQWEAGATQNIKLKTFLTLLEVLRTDYEYLVYGADRAPLPPRGKGQKSA